MRTIQNRTLPDIGFAQENNMPQFIASGKGIKKNFQKTFKIYLGVILGHFPFSKKIQCCQLLYLLSSKFIQNIRKKITSKFWERFADRLTNRHRWKDRQQSEMQMERQLAVIFLGPHSVHMLKRFTRQNPSQHV